MKIGSSTIWEKKYEPRTIDDLIIPKSLKTFLEETKEDQEVVNLLFSGTPGTGKTSTAKVIANELGEDPFYLNCSINTSINDIRYEVQSFATTTSLFSDGMKIVILDEFDRLSSEAMDSLKGLLDETVSVCRFIMITNNVQKVISPLISRCLHFSYGTDEDEKENMMLQMFKRAQSILNHENVKYDKKTLAKLVAQLYPDFRRTILTLQKFSKMNGEINESILNILDDSQVKTLIVNMKAGSFSEIMKFDVNPSAFYGSFYDELAIHIENETKPDVYVTIDQYAAWAGMTLNLTSNIRSCIIEVMKTVKWKR